MAYTLAFDIYGTIVDTTGVYDMLHTMVGSVATPFVQMWRSKQLEYSFRRGLMGKYADFSVCTEQALRYCVSAFSAPLAPEQQDRLLQSYATLPAFDDVSEGLRSLQSAGHDLYAFSNGSAQAVDTLLKAAGLDSFFTDIVSVEEVQTFKPSPVVYEHFNKRTKSEKNGTWLVSSNPFDITGACAFGMNTAWIQRSKEVIFDPWEFQPTVTVHDLYELSIYLDATR